MSKCNCYLHLGLPRARVGLELIYDSTSVQKSRGEKPTHHRGAFGDLAQERSCYVNCEFVQTLHENMDLGQRETVQGFTGLYFCTVYVLLSALIC